MDTVVSPQSWLLLLPQLPAKPDYLRVKLQRRLGRLGAVLIKNGVYALPLNDENTESSEWLREELTKDGGDLIVFGSVLCAGLTDDELVKRFESKPVSEQLGPIAATTPDSQPMTNVHGSVWVTRAGVFVDRIASAWLIRRFIDPRATFKFVDGNRAYAAADGEFRFDMYRGEFTHEGDRCTFETLISRFGLEDPALQDIAEIVHDIDCKDDKFSRAETPGVQALLEGIRTTEADDLIRIDRGSQLFETLFAQFSRSVK
jgi:hypothetical protein